MSAIWTSVTLPSGSKRSSSACVSLCCAKARAQPAGIRAAVAAANWLESRLEIIAPSGMSSRRGDIARGRTVQLVVPSGNRDALLTDDRRAVVVGPGKDDRSGFLRAKLELNEGIRRNGRLKVGGKHFLAVHRADQFIENLPRDHISDCAAP